MASRLASDSQAGPPSLAKESERGEKSSHAGHPLMQKCEAHESKSADAGAGEEADHLPADLKSDVLRIVDHRASPSNTASRESSAGKDSNLGCQTSSQVPAEALAAALQAPLPPDMPRSGPEAQPTLAATPIADLKPDTGGTPAPLTDLNLVEEVGASAFC